jgi:hypothetical protein
MSAPVVPASTNLIQIGKVTTNDGWFSKTATVKVFINKKEYTVTCKLGKHVDLSNNTSKKEIEKEAGDLAKQMAALAVLKGIGSTYHLQNKRFYQKGGNKLELDPSKNPKEQFYTKRTSLTLDFDKGTMTTVLSSQHRTHKKEKEKMEAVIQNKPETLKDDVERKYNPKTTLTTENKDAREEAKKILDDAGTLTKYSAFDVKRKEGTWSETFRDLFGWSSTPPKEGQANDHFKSVSIVQKQPSWWDRLASFISGKDEETFQMPQAQKSNSSSSSSSSNTPQPNPFENDSFAEDFLDSSQNPLSSSSSSSSSSSNSSPINPSTKL